MKVFSYKANLFPGQRINILAGIADYGNIVFDRPLGDGFRMPIDQAITNAAPESCFFGPFPILVPCENWTALVQAFFARYMIDGRPSSFAAAAALQAHSPQADATRRTIAARLGIKEEDADDQADRGFILVRVPRQIPQGMVCLSDPEYQPLWSSVLSDCHSMTEKLNTRLQSANADAVRIVLDTVENELGSHIIESISVGDEVFQIFVYERQNFKKICNAMDKSGWKDAQALNFRYFTSSAFLLYGTVPTLVSGDSAFSDVLPLLDDQHYGLQSSIFNLLLNDQAKQKSLTIGSLTCVGVNCVSVTSSPTLARLTATVYPILDPASELIDTVVIQSAIARFGAEGCGPAAVSGDDSISYATLYKPFTASAPISILWSPYVSLTQPYLQLDRFWNSTQHGTSAVQHLTVVADVIELQNSIDLSKLKTVTLVCRLLIAGKNGSVPTVKLSTSVWEPLQLYCGAMSGTCAFEVAGSPASHRVVYGVNAISVKPDEIQVVFDNFFGGKYLALPFSDTSSAADVQWRKTALKTSLETLLLASSAVLRPQAILSPGLKPTAMEAWKCLQWIDGYLQEIVDSFATAGKPPPEEIASLYGFSKMLARSVMDPRAPTGQIVPQVPSLRYTAYQDAAARLLDVANSYAEQIEQANQALVSYSLDLQREFREEERDASIRKMAQFMVDQNEAFAKQEDDLVACHNDIINKNNETILVLSQREGQIWAQYAEFLKKFEGAKEELVKAINLKIAEESAKMICEFVFSLVEVVGGIMTGIYSFKGISKAEGVEKTLKKWEVFLKFAETLNKTQETIWKGIENFENICDLNNSTPNNFAEPPTDTDWDIFMNDAEAQVRPAEEFVKPEVEKFVAAVRNLTAIAKSLNTVIQQKSQMQFNNFTEASARRVSEQQSVRLRMLKLNLDDSTISPSINYIADLGQFSAVLQQKQNNILNTLAEIAMLQDNSMTYYYLSKPSLLTQFDITAIQKNLAAQALSAVQTLATYPYPPTDAQQPVEVRAEHVAFDELMSDTGITINVSPTFDLFNSMCRVRVNSVDVRVDGVTTDKGLCHVQMISAGVPMTDRGLKREALTYKMISREWHVVYDIANDKTIIGTQPGKEWAAFFTKPTPFQSWRIRLPKTAENVGLRFNAATTTITLKFNVEMMYSTPPERQVCKISTPDLPTVADTNGASPEFLNLLKGSSITDGWDVVSFVSVDRINALWKQRWQAETDTAFQGDRMFVQQIEVKYSQSLPGNIQVDYYLKSEAGPPCLTFIANEEQCALVGIPLINGTLTTTTYRNGQQCGETTVVIESTNDLPVMVKTKAALQALPGAVDASNAVHINPSDGVFKFENIVLDPQVDTGFCFEISEYFKNQKLQPWYLGSLRFQADQDYLKPKTFKFRTYTPPPTHQPDWSSILSIYVLTTTTEPPAHGMRHSWPDAAWPVSTDFDAAVYFSADLLWKNEVIPALHQLADATVQIDPYTREYSAKFSGSEIVYDQQVPLKEGWENNHNYHPVYPHAKVTFPNSALSLKFSLTALDLSCNTNNWIESFPYQGRVPCPDQYNPDVSLGVAWDNVKVSCSFHSQSAPHIDPNTFNVTFDKLTISPQVQILYDTHKFLGIPILAQINPDVVSGAQTALEKKFSSLTIDLGAMSMFAVSNLLFPESKTLNPSGVYFPSDMVIVGQVTRTWTPPAK